MAARRRARNTRRPNPLSVSEGFRDFVLDQLDGLGDVVPRSMFGGVGLYCRGHFFGIVAGDRLYLKVDDSNRSDFERAGEPPFKPYPHRPATMQYYAVPPGVLEAAPDLVAWARKAVLVAEQAGSGSSTRVQTKAARRVPPSRGG
jgi:DNA transformation protein